MDLNPRFDMDVSSLLPGTPPYTNCISRITWNHTGIADNSVPACVDATEYTRRRLHRLNIDILLRILEHLQEMSGSILRLSLTCRILREVCKPIIFRDVTRKLTSPVVDPEEFFPAPLRPLVQ